MANKKSSLNWENQCAWCDKVTRKLYAVRIAGRLFSVCKQCKDSKEKERGF